MWLRELRGKWWRRRLNEAEARVGELVGRVIVQGPFEGMLYVEQAYQSQLAPKLLGTYEKELHELLRGFAVRRPQVLIDVGAAEGYYAVGLLRMFPDASCVAFEENPAASARLAELASLNGVGSRLEVRGRCDADALVDAVVARAAPALVVVDIDGGEAELFTAPVISALRSCWVVVELHPHFVPGIEQSLREAFTATHVCVHIAAARRSAVDCPRVNGLTWVERHFAVQEARPPGQGWLWCMPRHID